LAEEPPNGQPGAEALLKQRDEEAARLRSENERLKERLKQLENMPLITIDRLVAINCLRLKTVAADVKVQRQTMTDFESFVKWMTCNLSGYARYIEAGSVAAGFAKMLPIPYAGQASLMTRFVSQGILSLNASSLAIERYLATSRQFVDRVDAIDSSHPNFADVAGAARFADEQLLRDMTDLRAKLATAAEISTSTLSFLESLQHYIGATDEYWEKTKSILRHGEAGKKEKGFLSESIQSLRSRAGGFNGKLERFEETAGKDMPLVKTMGAYNELIRELDPKVAAVK